MQIGMLWFDDSSRPVAEKVRRAVTHYVEKYGREPTLCLVNPATLPEGSVPANGVEMKPSRAIMPNHFWIGVGERREIVAKPRKKAA